MSERLIETYLDALVEGDWRTFASCLADDGFTRVGPFGDVKATKGEYVTFLSDLMPTLPGYSMDVTRVTYSGSLGSRSCRRRSRSTAPRSAHRSASRSSSTTTVASAASRSSRRPATRPRERKGSGLFQI